MVSAGSIIGGAFRLVRERPGTVAVWGLVYMVATVAATFAMLPLIGMQTAAMSGETPFAASNISSMIGGFLLFELFLLILLVVLMTAAQRAVLRPAEQGFAYLRLGMDELRMVVLAIILSVVTIILYFLLALVGALVIGAGGAALGPRGAIPFGIIVFLALLGLFIWFEVRLSLAYPLTLLRRKIIIGEAWRVSRGHFWTLFLSYLVIFLVLFAIWMAILGMTAGPYLSALMNSAGNPEAAQQAVQEQMARQYSFSLVAILTWILGAAAGALAIALGGGAVATAARQLVGDEEGIAETFA
jgi:hypothetical protein